jgi:hypothetical protein
MDKMQVPTRKEIGRFSYGYITGLMGCSFIMLVATILVNIGWPFFLLYVATIGMAVGVVVMYLMALFDKDDIPMEIAMYSSEIKKPAQE